MAEKRTEQGLGYRKGNSVSVTRWKNHSAYKWRANFIEGGNYRSKGFKTKKEAEKWVNEKWPELFESGSGVPLTPQERSAVLEFRDRIAALGVPVRDVLKREVERLEMSQRSVTITEAVEKLIALKEAAGKSERNLGDIRSRLRRLARDMGDILVSDVTTEELDDWLLGLTHERTGKRISPQTWKNYRRLTIMLFRQCVTWGYCAENPAKGTQKPEDQESETGILTPDEAGELLTAAGPDIRSALAIGLFAGLRVSELQRLTWEEVDLENDIIRLEATATKKKFRRVIPIRSNLKAWLLLDDDQTGPIGPQGQQWRIHFAKARRDAGFAVRYSSKEKKVPEGKEWKTNAMRHSFASYGLQADQSADKIALELGHRGSVQVLHDHYKQTCTPKDAEKYWSISPAKAENVVAMTG